MIEKYKGIKIEEVGKIILEKKLEDNSTLKLLESESDVLQKGIKYWFLRLEEKFGGFLQYPTVLEKQKDYDTIESMYDKINTKNDFLSQRREV